MAKARGSVSQPEGSGGKGGAREIEVSCPNPECGKSYLVPLKFAGKRARCTECGAKTRIPDAPEPLPPPAPAPKEKPREVSTATPPPRPAPAKAVRVAVEEPPRRETAGEQLREMRIGCIGRGHAGKSVLFHSLGESLIGNYLPSGLNVDAADPREVARMIVEAEDSERLLHKYGLPPTLEVTQTRYCVSSGDKRLAICRMREVIGQILTHTLPDSEPRLQERYTEYLRNLVNADVLWAVVPCPPPSPSARDRRRYANDLRIVAAYVRESLRLRTLEQPASVALVLSKTDALFGSAEAARKALTDKLLLRSLGPLITLIQQSSRVSDAAVVPVTAFGFGKAVLREGQETDRVDAPGSADEPFGDEPIWLLKDGESTAPYNLDTLFVWSLLMGFLNQGGADIEADPELDTLCRMLRDDLEAGDPWLVPIKGGVKLATG